MIRILPKSNRLKRLIQDHGATWFPISAPRAMPCFDGAVGVTAMAASNSAKISNFRVEDVVELSN